MITHHFSDGLYAKQAVIALAVDYVWFCIHATDETDPSKVVNVLTGV